MSDSTPNLDRMHDLLARALLNRLEHEVICEKCERGLLTSAELTTIRQFLSDNKVTAPAVPKSSSKPSTSGLPFRDITLEQPKR